MCSNSVVLCFSEVQWEIVSNDRTLQLLNDIDQQQLNVNIEFDVG